MMAQRKIYLYSSSLLIGLATLLVAALVCLGQEKAKLAPTYKDVAYGPHERNVLDVWLAESATPTPLVVYIHGGGFQGAARRR